MRHGKTCMVFFFSVKECSSLHKFYSAIIYKSRLKNGTILKFLLMFLHDELCMQKVASVTVIVPFFICSFKT